MRVLGIDFGERRIGLAISDVSGRLARPLQTIDRRAGPDTAIDDIVSIVNRVSSEDEPIARIVVGLPARLDGSESEQTTLVREFARALGTRVTVPIAFHDERLSSREAESRLALRERDWRVRKKRLDAAAAAVILQDYLDLERATST